MNAALSNQVIAPKHVGKASSAERMATLERLNAMAGYAAPKTIFPEGTPLIDIGEKNLAREKAKVEALPTVSEFAANFLAYEKARDLQDVIAPIGSLRMNDSGHIYRLLSGGKTGPAIAATHTGLSQLVALHSEAIGLPRNAVGNLAFYSPKVRATMFNEVMALADERLKGSDSEKRVFRTALNAHGERYLRAVTSTKHVGQKGGYAAIVAALKALAPDAKIRVTHTEDRFDAEVIFPMMAREIRVGDVLWGALGVTISETKDVSGRAWDGLMRVLCVNLTRAYYGEATEWTRKHIGEGFLRDILGRLREGRSRLQPFVEAFGDSYAVAFPEAFRTRAEVVARAEKAFPEELKALPADSVIAAWDLDGARSAGDTLGGFVNALTRASQALPIESAESVESVAGRLVSEGWQAMA